MRVRRCKTLAFTIAFVLLAVRLPHVHSRPAPEAMAVANGPTTERTAETVTGRTPTLRPPVPRPSVPQS